MSFILIYILLSLPFKLTEMFCIILILKHVLFTLVVSRNINIKFRDRDFICLFSRGGYVMIIVYKNKDSLISVIILCIYKVIKTYHY